MNEDQLLARITYDPRIFGGKPIIRGRRLAWSNTSSACSPGDDAATILEGYPGSRPPIFEARLLFARKVVGSERVAPFLLAAS